MSCKNNSNFNKESFFRALKLMYHMDIVNSKRIKNSMLGLFIMMAKIKNKIKTMVCICVCMGGGYCMGFI